MMEDLEPMYPVEYGSMGRTDCFTNLTVQERLDFHLSNENHGQVEYVFRTYFGWAMLPMALLANLLTSVYITVVFRAISTRRVSRKCYILLLNRATSDLLSSVVAIGVCLYVLLAKEISRDVVILIESVFIGSFWTAMVSYVSLSAIKLICIWKPLQSKNVFTMRRCIHIIVFSWLVYVIMVSYAAGATAMVRVPTLTEWSGCRIETCLRIMYRVRHIVTIIVYAMTLTIFFTTVLVIKRGQRESIKINKDGGKLKANPNSRTVRLRRHFPLWKLTLNIVNFAVLQLFYVLWCIFRLNQADRCFLMKHFWELMHIMAGVKFTLVLRIIIDPILSFITDTQLRRCLFSQLGMGSKLSTSASSSSLTGRSTVQPARACSLTVKTTKEPHRSMTVRTIA